jgi:hypothetical protein
MKKKNQPFSEDYQKIYNAIIDDMAEEHKGSKLDVGITN